jgi:dCMP deaminase
MAGGRKGICLMTDWDQRYFVLAHHVAVWSKDPSTRVGAVIVGKDRRNITIGYNGFPPGIEDSSERLLDKNTKYAMTQHAERNALDNAHFDLEGSTLAVTMFPCNECAKSIVSRGIKRVITPPPLDREPWKSSAEWTRQMFNEVGIVVIEFAP